MDVTCLVHKYPPTFNSGAEVTLHAMLKELVAAGHGVEVRTTRGDRSSPYVLDGVVVRPGDVASFTAVAAGSDAVISHLENAPAAAWVARELGVPFVQILHLTTRVTYDWLVPDAALTVCCSYEMRRDHDAWRAAKGLGAGRSIVVQSPIFPADYETVPGDRVTLVNLCVDKPDPRDPDGLLMGKGAGVFWELAARRPDVEFLGVRGAYGEQQILDLPNVQVLEHCAPEDMRERVYGRTRILLIPSPYESWGRVGLEAMSSGIPVVANPCAGLRESLGAGARFVDRDDLDGWERAIDELLSPERWDEASRAARARLASLDDPRAALHAWRLALEGLGRG